jgi:hypothetical protein
MPRISTAIYFHDRGYGILVAGLFAQFIDDFENDSAFAFIAG